MIPVWLSTQPTILIEGHSLVPRVVRARATRHGPLPDRRAADHFGGVPVAGPALSVADRSSPLSFVETCVIALSKGLVALSILTGRILFASGELTGGPFGVMRKLMIHRRFSAATLLTSESHVSLRGRPRGGRIQRQWPGHGAAQNRDLESPMTSHKKDYEEAVVCIGRTWPTPSRRTSTDSLRPC